MEKSSVELKLRNAWGFFLGQTNKKIKNKKIFIPKYTPPLYETKLKACKIKRYAGSWTVVHDPNFKYDHPPAKNTTQSGLTPLSCTLPQP